MHPEKLPLKSGKNYPQRALLGIVIHYPSKFTTFSKFTRNSIFSIPGSFGLIKSSQSRQYLQRGKKGNGERGNASEKCSALLSTFLTISNQKSYSKNLQKPLEISDNLSELLGPLPLCLLPLYLSRRYGSDTASTKDRFATSRHVTASPGHYRS